MELDKKTKNSIQVIGHVDHGKTTLSAALISKIKQEKSDVLIINKEMDEELESKKINCEKEQKTFTITNTNLPLEFYPNVINSIKKSKNRKCSNKKIHKRKKAKNGYNKKKKK